MKKTTVTYTCDECDIEVVPEHLMNLPSGWRVLTVSMNIRGINPIRLDEVGYDIQAKREILCGDFCHDCSQKIAERWKTLQL